jgi:hypothetical protein
VNRLFTLLESLVFGFRKPVLIGFAVITVFMAATASRLLIDAGFEKLLPLKHPFMQTFLQYQQEFGGANKLLVAVRAKDGDMFTPKFFDVLQRVTDGVAFLPGINRGTVTSLYTPNVRFIEIVEGGFEGGNVIPAEFAPTPDMLARVRENILKSGHLGRLVANDFSAAMVMGELLERDPVTGERLDYLRVGRQLEEQVRRAFVDEDIDIHIIGFAKSSTEIAEGAGSVALFFGIAFLVSFLLVYLFSHSFRLTILPLLCSVIAVIWNLGIFVLCGFGLDPMSLLVPFLIFAIGVSHGVQMINAVSVEAAEGADGLAAARAGFRRLIVPGMIALVSDTVGFLTLLMIEIGIIQELALASTIGVLVIIVTNLVLLPILLSYLRFTNPYRERLRRGAQRKEFLWRGLARFARPDWAIGAVAVAVCLTAAGAVVGRDLRIGDLHAGVPELREDAVYNQDARLITEKFAIGVDVLTTIVETVPDGCIEHDIMTTIDRFQWHMANVPGVQSTMSLPQAAKIVNAGWNEGSLKWRVLPRNPQTMVQAISSIETGTGLLNTDCSVMPVLVFTEDHKAETIDRVVEAVQTFAAAHDADRHRFRLATGNVGVMASANDVVRQAQFPMLLYVYAAVIGLCLLGFRSLPATLCITLPLIMVSILTYGLMSLLEIGLKVPTLPVTALGVGIGVDYGIYIFSGLRIRLAEGAPLADAYRSALRNTGNAVFVTGLTLAAGTSTWIFSPLKFQADMGTLLTFMFLGNMIGALVLLPSLAVFILRKPMPPA